MYEIALWNDGTPVKDEAQFQINLAGAIEPVEMVEATNGFTCDANEFGFSCTGSLGGVDDPVQTRGAVFRVRGRGNGAGPAVVLGSADHFLTLDEMTEDNNVKLLEVTVQ